MRKIGLVLSEGGLSCAYSAGALYALATELKFTNPAVAVGSSGSTGTLAYYVSGQHESIKNIWTNLLASPQFVSLWRPNRILDIDYLIDGIFKRLDPLDAERLRSSRTTFYISATDVRTGKAHYFSNKDGMDIWELLRASSAMPFFYGKRVKLAGKDYIDGAFSAYLKKNVRFVENEGVDKTIVISNINRNFAMRYLVKLYEFSCKKRLRNALEKFSHEEDAEIESTPGRFVLYPSQPLPTSTLDNRRDHLQRAFEIGFNDARRSTGLKEFIAR